MKRWCVLYTQAGEVWKVRPGLQQFVHAPPSFVNRPTVQGNTFYCSAIDDLGGTFYCDAVDELGALARFMEAWTKEQTNA
jgi:hypothetical protein